MLNPYTTHTYCRHAASSRNLQRTGPSAQQHMLLVGHACCGVNSSAACALRKVLPLCFCRAQVCLVPVASSSGAVLLQLEFWLDLDGQRADAERTGLKKPAAQVRPSSANACRSVAVLPCTHVTEFGAT